MPPGESRQSARTGLDLHGRNWAEACFSKEVSQKAKKDQKLKTKKTKILGVALTCFTQDRTKRSLDLQGSHRRCRNMAIACFSQDRTQKRNRFENLRRCEKRPCFIEAKLASPCFTQDRQHFPNTFSAVQKRPVSSTLIFGCFPVPGPPAGFSTTLFHRH